MNDQLIISKLNEINTKLDKLLGAETIKPLTKKITIGDSDFNNKYPFKCLKEDLYKKYINNNKERKTKKYTKLTAGQFFISFLKLLDNNNYKYDYLIDQQSDNYKKILDLYIYKDSLLIKTRNNQLGRIISSLRVIYDNIDNIESIINTLKYYYKTRLLEIEHNQRPDVLPPKTEAKPVENIEPEAIGLEFINHECIF